ncbi:MULTISPECIES: HAD-IA family hydrolase [Pseudoalteromonas]|uniref:HAD-IA family hydrolase n=1 Tax=Pseudoalteromonas TaxID=53246 RepID=UPI000C32408B|nr:MULTISPECIES: HAD-IA family hydrolase [Pseudoalteromonas]PKG63277.1 hypothetical protein CXF75_15495 [Pseudoalteromonas arctica]PKG69592.1 hypothetical protein CXF64_14925 [Pseudoalteromonas sp. GutCa3]
MNKVSAVLFDLDNTLLGSSKLELARITGSSSTLEELIPKVKLFRGTLRILEGIKDKKIKMGIVTNSKRWYAERVLEYFEISHFFEVLITYDDVGSSGKKPNALGINMACGALNISNKESVLYVGDDQVDIEASYAAGVIPLAPTWAKTKIMQVPACVISTSKLVEKLDSPHELKLLSEAAADNENLNAIKGREFYFIPLNLDGEVVMPGRDKLDVVTFGRYFTNKSEITSTLRASHKLSRDISAKDAEENQESYSVPEYWTDLLQFILGRLGKFIYKEDGDFDIVTVIPSKPNKPPRLEELLKKVELRGELEYEFIPDLFYFLEDAASLKTKGHAAERNVEIKRSLHFNHEKYANRLCNKRVLVIDDVMTTGATFKRVNELINDEKVERIVGVSLAKTVQAIGPQKSCFNCHRPMRVLQNNEDIPFWSCSGYHEHSNRCTHSLSFEVKKCRRCGMGLVKKNGPYGYFLSHDWNLHGKTCNYTENVG